jgi:hypothetical protein
MESKSKQRPLKQPDGFAITEEVAFIEFNPNGEHSPHVAAFMAIATLDRPGTFRFPMPDGNHCVVDVGFENLTGAH